MKILIKKNCIQTYLFQKFRNIHVSSSFQNVKEAPKSSEKQPHCYRALFPWKTLEEFSNYLASSVVYNKDGLLVLNKPYGVKIHKSERVDDLPTNVKNASYMSLLAGQTDFRYSIEEALPIVQRHLGISELSILKSTDRYSSGIVLLSANQETSAQVRKSFSYAKTLKRPHLIYWAITRGSPIVPARQEQVGIKLIDIELKKRKEPVIVLKLPITEVKKQLMKSVRVDYRVLAINKDVDSNLMEIGVTSTKMHFLRVYTSSRAAPILGDTLYGSRMRTLLGRPINMNPNNIVANDVQPLPELMSQKLHLPQNVESHFIVPTMLHLSSVFLPHFRNMTDLYIMAPPPHHFQWTCDQLNLYTTPT